MSNLWNCFHHVLEIPVPPRQTYPVSIVGASSIRSERDDTSSGVIITIVYCSIKYWLFQNVMTGLEGLSILAHGQGLPGGLGLARIKSQQCWPYGQRTMYAPLEPYRHTEIALGL
jgi:hypothetical protein